MFDESNQDVWDDEPGAGWSIAIAVLLAVYTFLLLTFVSRYLTVPGGPVVRMLAALGFGWAVTALFCAAGRGE